MAFAYVVTVVREKALGAAGMVVELHDPEILFVEAVLALPVAALGLLMDPDAVVL